jgi:CRISPR-associated exonuclease Cas4
MESTSDLVSIGKLIHEESYSRQKKDEIIDMTISIDFIKKQRGIELHEIKKSNKMEKAHIFQMLYYLWYLKKRGITSYGIIDYPKLKKRVRVELTETKESELAKVLDEIKNIISQSKPPSPKRKYICTKCSYFELCFCDEVE